MSAATRVLAVVPLEGCGQVRMARTRHSCEQAIVSGLGVGVLENDGEWSTCGHSLKHTADNPWGISLNARSRALCTALPSEDILCEILRCQFESCRDSIKNHTDEFTVRLTKDRHPVFSSECIHIYNISFCIYLACHITLYHSATCAFVLQHSGRRTIQ